MKKIAGIIALTALVFTSCQKETSLDTGGNPGTGGGGGTNVTGDLLVKIVAKTGADSTVSNYEYDASKLLVRELLTGVSAGQPFLDDTRVVRNASGIITTTIQKNDQIAAQGIDSVITRIDYDAATGRYTRRVSTLELFGFSITDSSVAVYDASGKLIREDGYLVSDLLGTGPEAVSKYEFTYDASGNVSEIRISSADPTTGTPMSEVAVQKFSFDTKTTPLKLTAGEAFALANHSLVSPNNLIKFEFQNISTPASNFVLDYVYTYNSKNKPATGTVTETPGGAVTAVTYSYK